MFRNSRQKSEVLQTLLESVSLDHLWTPNGPTDAALRYRDANGGPLSSGERIMLLATFDLWNGTGGLKFAEMPGPLDPRRAQKLLSLLSAMTYGSDAVDRWLEREKSVHA